MKRTAIALIVFLGMFSLAVAAEVSLEHVLDNG
jgi:hypothetical protein